MSMAIHQWRKRHAGLMMLTLFTKKLSRFISGLPSRGTDDNNNIEFDEETNTVPKDVKEGHFAVVSVKGGEKKRFIPELRYLKNPEFLELLEQAKEEYGFQQQGVLILPCKPEELQNILQGNSINI